MAVNPELFIKRMEKKWLGRGQSVYQAQKDAWIVLCKTLNEHTQRAQSTTPKWSVVPLPTGVGKTEGVISYCAELAANAPETGVLIVTRFTEEADRITERINQEAGREIAITQHSKQAKPSKPTSDEAHEMQVLTITHAAYKMALAKAAMGQTEKIQDRYSSWKHGKRLIIVDEVLRVDEPLTVDHEELRLARHSIPMHIEKTFPKQIQLLNLLLKTFDDLINRLESEQKRSLYFSGVGWNADSIGTIDFKPFFSTLAKCGDVDVKNTFGKAVIKVSSAYRGNVLEDLINIAGLQGHCARARDKFQLTAVRMLMPDDIPDAVILDATAKQNIVYGLLGDFVELVEVPANVRDYSNVVLNILYGVPAGKAGLADFDKDVLKLAYQANCRGVLISDTLFCTHKSNRGGLKQAVIGLDDNSLVHWGDIDGKNNWSTLSGMVICGLQYLGQTNADNICLCFDQWMQKDGWKYHADNLILSEEYDAVSGEFYETAEMNEMPFDYWKEYEKSHMAVSVIQAINRVRCRNVTDDKGGCEKTNIYLFLGAKNGNRRDYQQHLLARIIEAMPNIQVNEKELKCGAGEVLSPHEKDFIQLLSELPAGEHKATDVRSKAEGKGISKRTARRYIKALDSEGDSEFKRQVEALGVSYIAVSGRVGSKFMKS
jgi:hypothetical protein